MPISVRYVVLGLTFVLFLVMPSTWSHGICETHELMSSRPRGWSGWAQDLLGKRTFLPKPLKVQWPYKKLNIIYPRGSACHRNMSCNIKFFFSLENRHWIFLILKRWINQLNKRGTLRWNIFHLYYIIRKINY